MKTLLALLAALIIAPAIALTPSTSLAREVTVASLDWPPFSGKDLPDGGAGIAVLREVLAKKGHTLKVEFLLWDDAIKQTADGKFDGVYPSWPNDVPTDRFDRSSSIFKSPIVFVFPKSKMPSWSKLEDLKGKKLGAVKGYGYTEEARKLMSNGTLPTTEYDDDYKLMEGLVKGEVEYAIYDKYVARYCLKTIAKEKAGGFVIAPKELADLDLLVGVKKGSASKTVFDDAIKGENTRGMLTKYFSKNASLMK